MQAVRHLWSFSWLRRCARATGDAGWKSVTQGHTPTHTHARSFLHIHAHIPCPPLASLSSDNREREILVASIEYLSLGFGPRRARTDGFVVATTTFIPVCGVWRAVPTTHLCVLGEHNQWSGVVAQFCDAEARPASTVLTNDVIFSAGLLTATSSPRTRSNQPIIYV